MRSILIFLIILLVALAGGVALSEWQWSQPAPAVSTSTISAKPLLLKVYFGNELENPGAMDCRRVFAVSRTVEPTPRVAQAALEALLAGPTAMERGRGYFSSLNSGVRLNQVTVEEGVARADFSSRLGEGVGGACLTTAIRAQITETLKQFPTVKEVEISIDGQSQDILQP